MTEFLDPRLTERRNPRSAAIDTLAPLELVDLINREDAAVPAAVAGARHEIARVIELVEQAFRSGGHLFYLGAGTSGRLGVLDAAECPPTYGSDPEMVQGIIAGGAEALVRSVEGAEDDTDAGAAAIDQRHVGPGDVVVGIAASGTTPFVGAGLERAAQLGAHTVLLTCSEPPARLRARCEICVVVPVGPEVVTGSTRMKAGTATKLVLNTITTGAMVRLGKVYGNLMVDVRAWNDKLVDRSHRILMEALRVDRPEAARLLQAANGWVKLAIVMGRRGVGAEEAARLLDAADGRLRAVVGDPPPLPE